MMAAKDVKMATDNLSCPVCYQLFKKPKYLPCHHSYCEQCLEMIQDQSKIICPECRKEAIVPPGGVKDLDDNFFINRLVDEFILNRKVEGEAEVKCDECSGEDPVVTFCPDCTLFLCHVCNEHHKRSNKSRGHGIVPLTELRSKKDVAIQPKPKVMMCREHDMELSFYCETCDQLVCMYCTVKDHNGHNHDTVKKMVSKHREELKKVTVPVEEMVRGLSDTHDDIEKTRKKITQQGDEVNKKIDQHYDRAIQKLTEEKKQLKQQVHNTVSQKEKAVTIQLSEVESVQAEVLKLKKLKDDLEKSFDQEVLSVKKEVIDRMQKTTDKYKNVTLSPVQQATMEFVCTQEVVPALGLLRSTDRPDPHNYRNKLVDKLLENQLATRVTKVQSTCGTGHEITSTLTSPGRRTSTSTTQLTSASATGVSTSAVTTAFHPAKHITGVTSKSATGVTPISVTGVRSTCTTGVITTNVSTIHSKTAKIKSTCTTGVTTTTITARTSVPGAISTNATGVISTQATRPTSIFETGQKTSTCVTRPVASTPNMAPLTGVQSTHGSGARMIPSTLAMPISTIHATNTTQVTSPKTPTDSKSGRKRKRCGSCDGCKATACLSCKPCTDPTRKKICIKRKCKNLQ